MSQKQKGKRPEGDFVTRNSDKIAYVLTALTCLLTLLLFNVRLDQGGDDATYICRALDLLDMGRYPDFQGPLYPIFLAPFIAIAGHASVVMLKLTSTVLLVGSQLLFYYTLRGRIGTRTLLGAMTLLTVNSLYLSFGSLTYSEALYIVVQWLAVWAMLKAESAETRRKAVVCGVATGVLIVVLALIRTVGYGWAVAAVAYMLIRRRWLTVGVVVGSVIVSLVVWTGIRRAVWGDVGSKSSQLTTLMQVDPYDASKGEESLSGYVGRFVSNSDLYLSKHYVKMLGLRDKDSRETNRLITIMLYALYAWGTYRAMAKRNGAMTLMSIGCGVLLSMTYVSLQESWDQYRLIIPYVGMMNLVLLYGVSELVKKLWAGRERAVGGVLVTGLALLSAGQCLSRADMMTLRHNAHGDDLYGYTPDWYNYLSMCRAVGETMNDSSVYVACRKPNMARIYAGGKKFQGIYTIPSQDADVLVEELRSRGVTHAILASLRRDPAQAGLGIINTMQRYMAPIHEAYPNSLTTVMMMGREDQEPAYLIRIDYEAIDAARRERTTTKTEE